MDNTHILSSCDDLWERQLSCRTNKFPGDNQRRIQCVLETHPEMLISDWLFPSELEEKNLRRRKDFFFGQRFSQTSITAGNN